MILSKLKEEYLARFFARQREISKKALETTASLAQSNMEMILLSGMAKPSMLLTAEIQKDVNIQEQLDEMKKELQAAKEETVALKENLKNIQDETRIA